MFIAIAVFAHQCIRTCVYMEFIIHSLLVLPPKFCVFNSDILDLFSVLATCECLLDS